MLKLNRPPSPTCLEENGKRWTQEFVERRTEKPKFPFRWRDQACYKRIRDSLLEVTGRRCAYCDGSLGLTSRETVDHFRPKSSYPQFAYAWENLFPCCDLCQSKKGERFEEGLLKTDEPEYEFSRYFILNFDTGEIEPAPDATPEDQARAETTCKMLGLNSAERNQARLRALRNFERDPSASLDGYSYRYFLV